MNFVCGHIATLKHGVKLNSLYLYVAALHYSVELNSLYIYVTALQ